MHYCGMFFGNTCDIEQFYGYEEHVIYSCYVITLLLILMLIT
jgi:hypothetical protein